MRIPTTLRVFTLAVLSTGCPPGPRGADGTSVTTEPEMPGAHCAAGGVRITSAAGTLYVCNGSPGDAGTPGTSVVVTNEPAGANCPVGGVRVDSELGSQYICNGAAGDPGNAGQPGQSVTTTDEPPGRNCSNGGSRFDSASGTTFACNGTPGASGQSVTSSTEPPGPNCANGGSRFDSATGTTFACNGTPAGPYDPTPDTIADDGVISAAELADDPIACVTSTTTISNAGGGVKTACVNVATGYTRTGGGCDCGSTNPGRLLVVSMPSGATSWCCTCKDHSTADGNGLMSVYVIGCRLP